MALRRQRRILAVRADRHPADPPPVPVATVARDSGLREILPAVFRGQLTPYQKRLLVAAVESALRRARPYHLEILALLESHFLKRHVRKRG